jgi:hypothetical protein
MRAVTHRHTLPHRRVPQCFALLRKRQSAALRCGLLASCGPSRECVARCSDFESASSVDLPFLWSRVCPPRHVCARNSGIPVPLNFSVLLGFVRESRRDFWHKWCGKLPAALPTRKRFIGRSCAPVRALLGPPTRASVGSARTAQTPTPRLSVGEDYGAASCCSSLPTPQATPAAPPGASF